MNKTSDPANGDRSATPVGHPPPTPAGAATERRLGWAIAASLVVNLGGLGAFALPGQDAVPSAAKVGAVTFAILALVGAPALWQHRRWGAWLTIVAANIVSIPIGATAVALLRRRDVRSLLG